MEPRLQPHPLWCLGLPLEPRGPCDGQASTLPPVLPTRMKLTPDEAFVVKRTMALATEWGLPTGRVRVTNRQNSMAQGHHHLHGWTVTYGRTDIQDTHANGMRTYTRVEAPILERAGLDQVNGRWALLVLAAHEFSHILVRRTDGYYDIKPHGPEWRAVYEALLNDVADVMAEETGYDFRYSD